MSKSSRCCVIKFNAPTEHAKGEGGQQDDEPNQGMHPAAQKPGGG